MQLKSLAVVAALVLGCASLASATVTTYHIVFTGYCDTMTLNLYNDRPIPKILVGGTHFNYSCSGADAYLGGFQVGISPTVQYDSSGSVLMVSDQSYGLQGTNSSVTFLINIQAGTWILWSGNNGKGEEILNEGTFTLTDGEVRKGASNRSTSQR
jgi:hypothetical protein